MMGLFDTSFSEILASINLWKVATIALLAMNVKCLPFVWHVGRLPRTLRITAIDCVLVSHL